MPNNEQDAPLRNAEKEPTSHGGQPTTIKIQFIDGTLPTTMTLKQKAQVRTVTVVKKDPDGTFYLELSSE